MTDHRSGPIARATRRSSLLPIGVILAGAMTVGCAEDEPAPVVVEAPIEYSQASPEALLAWHNAFTQRPDAEVDDLGALALHRATNEAEELALEFDRTAASLLAFLQAAHRAFGGELSEYGDHDRLRAAARHGPATLIEQAGDRARATRVHQASGDRVELELVRIDGSWWLAVESMAERIGVEASPIDRRELASERRRNAAFAEVIEELNRGAFANYGEAAAALSSRTRAAGRG